MSNYAKAARLILVVTAPVLAMAQGPQAKPSPQVRSAASAPSVAIASPTPTTRPVAAPNSQRPVAPGPVAANNNVPLQSRPVVPQATQPALAALPVIAKPQPAVTQPAVATGSSASATGRDASAAVDYSSGQLTVVSNRAPLSLVLKLVAAKTGALVDLAPELQNELVVARLGPGSVREVLTGLLDSPRIDYIVLGTGDEPGSLHRIVVRTRRSFGQVAMAATRPQQARQGGPEDENGQVVTNGTTPPEGQLTQEQLMENWRKIREEKIQAEIKQQAEDRENEKNQPPEPPMPQDNPPQDNPPQR
jgi:hypothetical protein